MGSPSYTGRDNANQITLQDGIAPISNMYLWQPIGSAFYPPCVDGDSDMTAIGHEFRSVSAVPRGGGLRIAFARRVASPVNVDVFQQSRGRRVIDNLLVARFARRTRSFTWKGKPRAGKRLTRGRYFVRFRMPTGAGRRAPRRAPGHARAQRAPLPLAAALLRLQLMRARDLLHALGRRLRRVTLRAGTAKQVLVARRL